MTDKNHSRGGDKATAASHEQLGNSATEGESFQMHSLVVLVALTMFFYLGTEMAFKGVTTCMSPAGTSLMCLYWKSLCDKWMGFNV